MRKLALLFGLPALGAALSAVWPAAWSAATAQESPPAYVSRHETHAEDTQAIQRLLRTYTTAMKNGDRALFESLLLNEQIPFSSTDGVAGHKGDGTDTRHYPSFRDAVFASGARYTQSHYNVHIAQDGPLAQVSLDFVTQKAGGGGAYGWKLLQLVKIQGQWKIASELYTARALPAS